MGAMNLFARLRLWLAAILIMTGARSHFGAPASDGNDLVWRKGAVSASVANWQLKRLLSRLSSVTGWKIFVDPGIDETVTVRFSGVSQSEALKLLLGTVNYALIP